MKREGWESVTLSSTEWEYHLIIVLLSLFQLVASVYENIYHFFIIVHLSQNLRMKAQDKDS